MMLFDVDDAAPIPLDRRPFGIEKFRVEGYLDSQVVRADRTGTGWSRAASCGNASRSAMAVDEVFADSSQGGPNEDDRDAPEAVMLALLTCCDEIDLAEYEVCGYRRVIAPNA